MPGNRQRMTARRVQLEAIEKGNYHKKEGYEPNYVITPIGVAVSRACVVATVVDTFQNDEETYGAITLDDSSSTLRAKFFQDLSDMDDIEEGQLLEVIGKVKEYDGERYIQPELMKERSIKYELLHNLEMEQTRRRFKKLVEKAQKFEKEDRSDEDIKEELKGEGLNEKEANAVIEYLNPEEQFEKAEEVESKGKQEDKTPEEHDGPEDEEEEVGKVEKAVLERIEELDEGEGADYSEIIEAADYNEDEIESAINNLLSDGTCYEPKPGKIKKL
ncbi:MAG: hypothetical protein MUP58_00740 [Candidatus Nanohaloarchaeota archaeon QJJ-9]|nr:hypothetical protein [Candidatus Nanohaloarchaeota archaeon QJJ-9]